jgi:hypothetical protein
MAQSNLKCAYKRKSEAGQAEEIGDKSRSELEEDLKMLQCWLRGSRKGPGAKGCKWPL